MHNSPGWSVDGRRGYQGVLRSKVTQIPNSQPAVRPRTNPTTREIT